MCQQKKDENNHGNIEICINKYSDACLKRECRDFLLFSGQAVSKPF